MNILQAMQHIIELQKLINEELNKNPLRNHLICAHYHYQKPRLSVHGKDGDLQPDYAEFSATDSTLKLVESNNFSDDVEATKQHLSALLAKELPAPTLNPKLNANNGPLGDTPQPSPTAALIEKLQAQVAQLTEQNRNLLAERTQRLEAEKPFSFIAGNYEAGSLTPNIKLNHDNLTIDEALALYMENMDQPFGYIRYKGVYLIGLQGVMEQAA